ncbi:MAG: MBL fold metallo-hydrolase [Alphaproteobacteria bacterium]|nr:MBL fold metallo-hydrolase [Alphaproteobacteria bacterium]
MNTPLNELTPVLPACPEPGQVLEVAPGVRWLRMALPFALNHINLWLLRDTFQGREGWTLVDTCIDHPSARQAWEEVFAKHLDGLPIVRVVITHMHPDHIGLAHWLCEHWQAPMWISATDYINSRMGSGAIKGFGGEVAERFYIQHGMTHPDHLAHIRDRGNYYARMVPQVPASYRRLLDGMTVDIGGHAWRCISGHGHAPEHMALFDAQRGILISGDMVLPRISTNVAVYDAEPEGDPLGLFLDSIHRFLELPADAVVLPSHGEPFRGLHARVAQLAQHHQDRLAELMDACAQSQSAYQILPVLFRRELDPLQTTFAMGEAIAHLNHLWHRGQLHRTRGTQGEWRFQAT